MQNEHKSQNVQVGGLFKFCVTLCTMVIIHLNLNYSNCDSKVEHPKGLKLGFNSMFQILKLVFQKGWHYSEPLESKDITKFHTQQTQI